MALVALLDADVLVNAAVRDTILRAAEADLFRPVFSHDILAEMRGALERNLGLTEVQTEYLLSELVKSFGDSLVESYEGLIPAMRNAVEDRHVLAAAVRSGAEIIVSFNVRDFPPDALRPYGIEVQAPDDFLVDLWQSDPELMARILNQQAEGLTGWTVGQVLERLSQDVPRFVALVRRSDLMVSD